MTVRTRFAPSPTGFAHVGGIRTALFAYLIAKQGGGQFVLRLEDTDKSREVDGSAAHLIESLKTLGLQYDEGPDIGGPYAPYKQSERLSIYKAWAEKLVEMGRAYADPYTPEQLQQLREEAQTAKRPFLYRNHRPENPPAWDGTTPLRFKSDPHAYTWHDEVMGDMHAGAEAIDDFILMKSDGYPTYNFAHIVDDAEMRITHVIRGQEFISSMPNYLNLYDALGFDMSTAAVTRDGIAIPSNGNDVLKVPVLATMPHILNEQGNKKLGKRDGAKDVLDYVKDGYLPETMLSFIATLGWNDGTEQETFTKSELITKFSLDRVQRSGARFDEKRLLWMNGQFIRSLSTEELSVRVDDFWPEGAKEADPVYRLRVLELAQDRLKTLRDLPTLTSYFFTEPRPQWVMIDDSRQLGTFSRDSLVQMLRTSKVALETTDFTPGSLESTLNQLLNITGEKPGTLFSLIRFAVTWAPFSPALPETLEVLGRERTLSRIQRAIEESY